MADNQKINELLQTTIQKVRDLGNAETVIGTPITVGEVTIVPVSKLSCGLAAGGSDYASKKNTTAVMFGGGGGAGVEVTPLSFIVIKGTSVEVLPAAGTVSPGKDYIGTVEKAVEALPGIVEKLSDFITAQKEKKAAREEKSELDIGTEKADD